MEPPKLAFTLARGALVLIVDDDPLVRALTSMLLERMGGRSEGVATGAEASAHVARVAAGGEAIDIVLLDQNLQRETGAEVCRRLRREGLDAPIVAMSGEAISLGAHLHEAGFDAFLKKPFSAEDLHACVEGCIGRSRRERVEGA